MPKQDNSFEVLAKGYEDILHVVIDNIENKDKEMEKSANTDILIKLFGWFLENNIEPPEKCAKYVAELIKNGAITHSTEKSKGFSNKGYESAMTCLDIFNLVLQGQALKESIEQYAKSNHIKSTEIYKRLECHGKIAQDIINMIWDTPLTPEQQLDINAILEYAKN